MLSIVQTKITRIRANLPERILNSEPVTAEFRIVDGAAERIMAEFIGWNSCGDAAFVARLARPEGGNWISGRALPTGQTSTEFCAEGRGSQRLKGGPRTSDSSAGEHVANNASAAVDVAESTA